METEMINSGPEEITKEQAGYLIASSMSARFAHEESAALQGALEDAALALYQAWVMATDLGDKPLIAHCSKSLLVAQKAVNDHLKRVSLENEAAYTLLRAQNER